jgi:nitrite reductase (NADH) large subunit
MTRRLRIGYVPLTDAALLHVAKAQQLAARRGLDVELVAESSWANIRDKLVAGHFDAAHLLEGDHMSEPLVVVGNGMAATRFVDELMQRALGRYSVIVIGAEPRLSYNRVLLSSLLAGEVSESAIELKPRGWWNRYGVTTLNGQAVASIDRRGRVVTLADGQCFIFSKLVLATGSHPVRLPKPGMDLQNVLTFRDLADVSAMRALMRQGARAAVIGGGLLGIEAAYGLAKAGVKVALVHLMDRLMERQLDERAALLLKRAIEAEGIEVLLGADTKRVLGEDRATGLELSDARVVPADFVVCAVDIRPNAELAREAGLAVNGGILVDDGLTTSDPNGFALGECAEHRGCVYGLVGPANEQARILARRLASDRTVAYLGSTLAANLRVSGVNVFSRASSSRLRGAMSSRSRMKGAKL